MEELNPLQKVKLRALTEAGWRQIGIGTWKSPSGLQYRGLEACYKLMKDHPELNSSRLRKSKHSTAR